MDQKFETLEDLKNVYYYSKLIYKKDLHNTLQERWSISMEFITVRSSYISKVGRQNFVKTTSGVI